MIMLKSSSTCPDYYDWSILRFSRYTSWIYFHITAIKQIFEETGTEVGDQMVSRWRHGTTWSQSFPYCWLPVREIHWSQVVPHAKGQWCWAICFLIDSLKKRKHSRTLNDLGRHDAYVNHCNILLYCHQSETQQRYDKRYWNHSSL